MAARRKKSGATRQATAMDSVEIGRKIRALRTKMGLTTVTLAKKMRLSQAQISRLENGLQGFRSVTLLRFARVLGVSPVYFLVDGESTEVGVVATELEACGLTPSATLRAALANPAFLRFLEKCAKAMKGHKKNLARMDKAIKHEE